MNKTIITVLCLCLVVCGCFLSGCRTNKTDDQPDGIPASVENKDAVPGDHHFGALFCENEETVYFLSNMDLSSDSWLVYIDKKTQAAGYLCGKPECLHTDSECNAWAGSNNGTAAISLQKGQLIIATSPLEPASFTEVNDLCIYTMNPDGTERKLLRQIKNPWEGMTRVNTQLVIMDDYLIVSGIRQTIKDAKFWNVSFVKAYSFQKENDIVLYEGDETSSFPRTILQTYGKELWFLNEQDTKDQTSRVTGTLYRWAPGEPSAQVVYDGDLPSYMFELQPDQNVVRFCGFGSADMYELNIEKGQFQLLYEGNSDTEAGLFEFYDGGLISCIPDKEGDASRWTLETIDTKKNISSRQTVSLPFSDYTVDQMTLVFCGSDEDAFYYYFDAAYDIERREWLVRISRSGQEAKVLWSR